MLLRECSGGQKHLIYVLRELAARRPILLCDELICGLDADRQARVMSMLRERRAETAVLFITTDLHSLAVMCSEPQDQGAPESLGCTHAPHCLLVLSCNTACLLCAVMYMHEGEVVERGGGGVGGGEMMVRPTSAPAREYVSAFRSMLKDPVRPQLLSDRLLVLRSLSLVRVTGGHDWRGASRGDAEAAEAAEQGQSMSSPAR